MNKISFKYKSIFLSLFTLLWVTSAYAAPTPAVLHFSDLISGPSTGLGDGKGSGVIVTIWGQNLGSNQGLSKLTFIDSEGKESPAAHIYYWKNADGTLPSGPANLYESHRMQEIAFSIPESPSGPGTIKVSVNGNDATLPFTVRDGKIFHVRSNGSDSGDGSYANPWLTVGKADSTARSGATLYIHDITTGSPTTDMAIFHDFGLADSTLAAQFAYVAYPNTRPEAIGARGFNHYNGSKGIDGLVISKYSVFSAEADTDENDLPVNKRYNVTYGIVGSKDGRAIGNYVTDEHPSDTNGACPEGQQAAITGDALGRNKVENWKVLGNMIEDYGCAGTNRQHHTTYFTVRSSDENLQLVAPEVGYNYLKNNRASGGLHYFDENHQGVNCGYFITPFKIHNNVVINQTGPAIENYAKCPTTTTFEYYNNIAINSGYYDPRNDLLSNGSKKLTNFEAVFVGQVGGEEATNATLNFTNNTFIGWNDSDQVDVVDACIGFHAKEGTLTINWDNNICITDKDKRFMMSDYQGTSLESRISGSSNVWYSSSATKEKAQAPGWDAAAVIADPMVALKDFQLSLADESPVANLSTSDLSTDVYGIPRSGSNAIGAVTPSTIKSLPKAPHNFNATPIN